KRLGETPKDVETRLTKAVKRRAGQRGLSEKNSARPLIEKLRSLHAGSRRSVVFQVEELELIAEAYRIPRLMLDPMVSERVDAGCLVGGLDELTVVGGP